MIGTLRSDLWTAAADPLPRMRGPRPLARLPHVLVVLYAVVMVDAAGGHGDPTYSPLAIGQAAAVVLALFRPVPAWWVSLLVMAVGSQTGLPVREHPIYLSPGTPFSWSSFAAALQAMLFLLVALRVRPRVLAEMVAITVLVALAFLVGEPWGHHTGAAAVWLVIVLAAAVIGAALRGARVARTQLVVQEEVTAEERARRAVLEARNRIARELHDVVAHHMSVISIQAQVAPHLVENPSQELKDNLAGIRQNAVEALAELRRVLGVLRSADGPADDAPQPTLDQVDDLIAKVRIAGLTVTATTTGEPRPLSPGIELSAFRILQEALSNAMRHAPGASVRVEIAYRPGTLALTVRNTAPRRPAPSSHGAGLGLLGMRERAHMLGGELAAGPTPDGGYEVTAALPAEDTP
ncbi:MULTISPECIES: sensor histidine kinase [Nonomuraea]|uniref:histidine kinase n=1 Tax=Nonomuraea ferruginea TaxID=46174 RepID=A0ABT4SX53_9ACTN|nr:sensor histidine kinase [Nonomuraea ferruginea]MDA0641744.1 sensor histidine kinase [Nonomuraea ferruginea]